MISGTLAAASDADWAIITDLVVILVSAAVVAVVMQRMRLAAIPAYLIAGAVIPTFFASFLMEKPSSPSRKYSSQAQFRIRSR